jgi:predicted Fe-Mo cluster-binding NifX family protein
MKFSERLKELWDQGLAVSKDFAVKTGGKAQELGERGVLLLEIKQLEGQAQKLVNRLGNEAYKAFAEQGIETVSAESAPIKGILEEIALIKDSIEKKDAELQSKKNGKTQEKKEE